MLHIRMPGKSYQSSIPQLTPVEKEISRNLQRHVRFLAEEIGQRNIWNPPSMQATSTYIENEFSLAGYTVSRQTYETYNQKSANLEVELPGYENPEEIIVVGAHYDTVLDSPGANDNASGVAALLELSRLLQGNRPRCTIRLVAFTNEEAPFYFSDNMGSRQYARRARSNNEKISAMISLETIGYYSAQERSQQYPFPFSLFYPTQANFIAFVGNTQSRRLVRKSISAFRRTAHLPSEGLAAPGFITGIGWSDHWSFWKEGYPAIMITDTAFFRYAHYHTEQDTPEKIDYNRMALLTKGLIAVISDLAGLDESQK